MVRIFRGASRWRRTVSLVAGLSLAGGTALGAGVFAQTARAGTDGSQVSGSFQFAGKLLTRCPLGAVLCTSGSFSGSFQAPFQFSILTILPSATVGVEYFDGQLVAQTPTGDLHCDLNGALDARSNSVGEFGEICVITGGTGVYKSATGHLRLMGVSSLSPVLGIPTGSGEFRGTITGVQAPPT
jgi:hypothetical protein